MSTRIFVSTFAMLLFTGACGDDGDGPQDTTDATTDASTTDASTTTDAASTTDDTAEPPPTTSSASATGDGETTTAATTGDPTTDTGVTTDKPEPDPAVLAACQAYCERWGECGFQPDLEGCVEGCNSNQFGLVGECKQANLDLLACTVALSCEELLASLEEGGACGEQEAAVTDACAGDECAQSVFGGDDACELQFECPDAPLQQMICDGPTCTCLEGGENIGECPAEGVCASGDGIFAAAARCCGF
ncbi:hypothetical protein [Nannocystis punicea]|uniref:Uncharacterized protein n=1 Tax=Nannocystis punicea TaxID=2995304 RepID=A0ABY7GSY7_9BACT|nr:hypothetical protein [Nannocystis poenicansa]WAS90074.1 hypothetical protein O0S08_28095 [Nannocystis poenicansa]